MKKSIMLLLAIGIGVVAVAGYAKSPFERGKATQKSATHENLAYLLAQQLHLLKSLDNPEKPRAEDLFRILLAQGVRPISGWEKGKVVTKEDLAVTVVQAMRKDLTESVDTSNPQKCIEFLKRIGVPIMTAERAVTPLGPLHSDEEISVSMQEDAIDVRPNVHTSLQMPVTVPVVTVPVVTEVVRRSRPSGRRPRPTTPDEVDIYNPE